MAEAGRVEGIKNEEGDIESWSKWLTPQGIKEYDNIVSSDLKSVVHRLARRPDELTPPQALMEFYDQIEDIEEKLAEEEGAEHARAQARGYMKRIGDRAAELAKSQSNDTLLKSIDKKLGILVGKAEQEEPEIEALEPVERTAEGWARMVLTNIAKAEERSETTGTTSTDDGKMWLAIDKAIDKIPRLGVRDGHLSDHLTRRFPEGVFLKEKLRLYFDARKKINDRFIEVRAANGSLAAMGMGSEDIQLKNLKYTIQEIEPIDWWMLVNGDRVLAEDLQGFSDAENRELLPDVDKGMTEWWNSGFENYDAYKVALNSSEEMADFRRRVVGRVGSNSSENLAFRAFSVTLTLPMFDRDRKGQQGRSEDRDLMWSDEKRKEDFAKEKEPGVHWTIGRYFVRDGQEGLVRGPDAGTWKMAKRKNMLLVNSKRGVFLEQPGYNRGEVVSDFFSSTTINVPDELGVRYGNPRDDFAVGRKLISYVIGKDGRANEGGWRKIPFLRLGQQVYSGYFGTLKTASAITKEMGSSAWTKVDEIKPAAYWEEKRAFLDRMGTTSPWFNSLEFEFRGKLIRDELVNMGGFSAAELSRIVGYSSPGDLSVITNPTDRRRAMDFIGRRGRWIREEAKRLSDEYKKDQLHKIRMIYALGTIWQGSLDAVEGPSLTDNMLLSSGIDSGSVSDIIKALRVSRFLEGQYLEHFKYEVWREMGFGPWLSAGKKKERPLSFS